MSEETRITANLLPKDTRITAEPPSEADTRICLTPSPRQEQSKRRRFWIWLGLFSLLSLIGQSHLLWEQAKVRQRQAEIKRMQKVIDEMMEDFQRQRQEGQRAQ